MKQKYILLFLLAPFAAFATNSAKPSTELVSFIQKVQTIYDDTKDFEASFRQKYRMALFHQTYESTGTIRFKKPGLMRWDYLSPSEKSFVVQKNTLWIYQKKDNSALVNKCFSEDSLTASIAFLWGKGKILEEFNPELLPSKEEDFKTIKLIPKKPNAVFKHLILKINNHNFRVTESVVVDLQKNENFFAYDQMKFNQNIEEKTMEFKVPPNTEIMPIPGTCKKDNKEDKNKR